MKKILFVAALFFYTGAAVATDITWDDKVTGGSFTADDANAIKTAVNSKADKTAALVGDCTVGPCLDGSTDGGNLIKLWAGTGSYWTALQGGAPAANRSWRLPIDAPPSAGEMNVMTMDEYGQMGFLDKPSTSGYVLSSTDAGVLSWIANGSGGSMVYPAAGIPNSTGSAWGTSYSTTSLAAALDGESWTFTGAVDMSGASSVIMGPISFEGATADAYETTFSITDPTADRTITVGDYDSTIPAATTVDANGKILSAGLADTPSANGVSLFTAANYAAMRSLLDLEAGTDFNAFGTIVQGSSPTVDAAGEIAIDTTSDQIKYYGGAERVLTYKKQVDFVVKTPVDADDFLLLKAQTAITITDIHVIAQGGTSISVDIQECDSAGANCATVDAAITADTDGAEDDGTLSNGTIDAGDWIKVVLGAPSGSVSFLTGSIYYVETAN